MGRALKILAYAVILFLTYLIITAALKSCNKSKDVASAEMENPAKEEDLFEDDYFEDGQQEESGKDDFFGSDKGDENINYDAIDEALESRENTKKNAIPETNPDYTSSSGNISSPATRSATNGNYLVVAGSYIINTNAENMILKLKKMGYSEAEVVIFDQSQYHTAVALRTNNYDDALSTSNSLKSKGIDSYVHTRKY